ncbi:putative F-box/FBD/LRR-repeat protein At1g78760 [Macadamia integrifolia]|uniref:putative F-box/FBD/LRR-repeat protein At1g78760 n=1 Tax=Macadamia integrifolia TaxID=60698 RepID=UPI001C4E54FC|nr:putative F-box/FBD/LRR-repeat protein At1g78760 [Macadamia integrifolia]XP_042503889.1 putative F-box/FBD/LRR-repeat protein At1g78760 [Macadamia integrifolia]XP_042503890.1 putative F-box/FBD/LRR-repeat protein At1g78760 [Macadamia integrifolia]XP_042503891.1 putative F-box/FBD/LRR-repeat protein At1g78760 [Macadamia integrifolia]XP_042503892.1 putative F-box/FBD/LRR-repeat protein At1g78760 [Macadamia integrifolia]
MSECYDRISDLPDSVIHHILSFLPIKDVIRTSFLSSRWRYLWASVPSLYFDGFVFSPKTKFVKFVDSVLLRRNGWGIQKFCLRFSDYYCDTSHAYTWISTAVSHNVQELSVYYYPREHFALPICLFELPICLFRCKSLRVLKLNLYESILNLPPSIHLPFLNTLHLISVTFSDNNLTRKLFSNCPVLKEVILEDCAVRDLSVLHISSLSIERLTIDGLPRDVVLCSASFDHEIKICAPRLLSIKYINYKGQNICLEKATSLVDAAIYLNNEWDDRNQICCRRVINFLRDLSNAKVLMVSSQRAQLLSAASNILGSFPKFFHLNHLKLAVAVTSDNIRLITRFLNSAPDLEFLTIDIVRLRWSNREEDSEPQNAPFACVINHLKDIKITGFGGTKDELVLVKCLLENATVLERMTIVPSKQLLKNSELRMKISQEIQMYPSASTSSVIMFS